MLEGESPEIQRTTAMGFLTDAEEMLEAAVILHKSGVWKVTGPTYYLLGHAIELALKSFLVANGDSLNRMRLRIGHDLAKAARRVVATKCEPLVGVVSDNMAAIELLNFYYKEKELEYPATGTKTYPGKEVLIDFLRSIVPIIQPLAYQAYKDGR